MRRNAGFSLIEMVVSMGVGMLVLAAVVRLVGDSFFLVRESSSDAEIQTGARNILDLLSADIRNAGVGVGYKMNGDFSGVRLGEVAVDGGATFNSQNRPLTLEWGDTVVDDLMIRMAPGAMRSIVSYGSDMGQVCKTGEPFLANSLGVFVTREGLQAHTAVVSGLTDASCEDHNCVQGCMAFRYQLNTAYSSDNEAAGASYLGGFLASGYNEVIWYVEPGSQSRGELRRLSIGNGTQCSDADRGSCGGAVSQQVENMQLRYLQWDDDNRVWKDVSQETRINGRGRIRVDVELILRGPRDTKTTASNPRESLVLEPGRCVPGPCDGGMTDVPRTVVRSSVEVRNSGRMQIK